MIPTLSYRADEPGMKQAAAFDAGWTENDAGELVPAGVDLIDVDDMADRRGRFYKSAASAITKSFPKVYGGLRMEVGNVDYDGPEDWTPAEQKKALLTDGFLARKLRGDVSLFDDKTGELIEQKRVSLMRVPHLTERGTFIHGGNEYTTVMQSRLVPGVYTRRRGNGELETQFNVRPGTGRQFRVGFEPESAQYRLRVSTANLHLYSLLHDLGVPDEQLAATWGDEILGINRGKYDKRVFEKAYQKFVPPHMRKEEVSHEAKKEAIRGALEGMQMSELVARRHLPVLFDRKKQAAYREPAPVWFDPDLVPSAAKASTRWTVGEDYRVKLAAFTEDELRVIALFLRENAGAALPMDLTQLDAATLEEAIIGAVTQGDTGVNAAILQAGVQGLANVKQADFYEDLQKAAFDPSFEPDDIVDVYNNVYGQVGPRLASMKQWPEAWLDEQDPMGWLQWYEQYHAGRRSDQDERQIRRWERFKARHGALYVRNPTPRRGFALRNWAIDGPAMLPDDQQEQARRDMEDYRQGTYKPRDRQKAASTMLAPPEPPAVFTGTKPARRNDEDDPGDTFVPVGIDGILASTEKLLAVNRGLEEPDERDSLPNDRIYMPHDLLAERIRIDTGKLGQKAMRYAARHRSLRGLMPFAFDDYATGLLVGNPLSQPLEEINPMQIAEQARRFTKMGPGGIGDPKAITVEMQSVHPSHFGFISPLEGPESEKIGVDARITVGTKVGSDRRLYTRVFDKRNGGKIRWVSPEMLQGRVVKIPD